MSDTAVSIDEMKPFILEKNEFLLNNSDLFTKSQKDSEIQQPVLISDIYSQAKYSEEDAENLKRAKKEELTYVDFSFDYNLKKFAKNNYKDAKDIEVSWMRISDVLTKTEYQVFGSSDKEREEEPSKFKIKGEEGRRNQELKSAFALLRRFKDERYLTRLVSQDPSGWEVSAYEIKLNIGGVWTEIIIDDYFPVVEDDKGNLSFCFMEPQGDENEIVEMLIEKALAKSFNGYHKLKDVKVEQFINHLTGVPVIRNKILDLDHLQFLDYSELNIGIVTNFETLERKIGVVGLSLKTGNPILRVAMTGEELEINSVENLEVFLVKLRPNFSYNSVHIPLSSTNFIQAVVKIGIQDEGAYTFQIHQKPQQLYPKNSPFSYNKICMTLAKLVEGGVEYVDHTTNTSDMTASLTLNNIQFEGNYVLLIDVESNKRNYIYENQYKGDLGHWRDIVLSVYGTEYCRLDSLALDPNRGMIYDFFLHRTWKHFSRTHNCEEFNKPFIRENDSESLSDPKLLYIENYERRVWMLNLGEEYGDIEIIRECFIMENLMIFKFINNADFNIEIVDLLMNKLEANLECFGPFEVNNIDPSLLVNSKSDEILLFKYNNKLKSVKNLKLKNSNFAVSPCDNSNPEEYYGQDPYDYMTKLYTVQPSRTYPMCSFSVEVDGYIVNNLKKEEDSLTLKMKAHDLYEIGDSCDLFEVIEGELFCKGPSQLVEVECFNGAMIKDSHNFVDLEEEDKKEKLVGNSDLLNPGSQLDEENNNFIFESARMNEEEEERVALAPKSDTETKMKVESELDYEQYYSRDKDFDDNQEESVLMEDREHDAVQIETEEKTFEEAQTEKPLHREEPSEKKSRKELIEEKQERRGSSMFDINNTFQEPFQENPDKISNKDSMCIPILDKSDKHYVVSFGNSKCFDDGSNKEIEQNPQNLSEKKQEWNQEYFSNNDEILIQPVKVNEENEVKEAIEEEIVIENLVEESISSKTKSEKKQEETIMEEEVQEEEEKIIVNTRDNFFDNKNRSFVNSSSNKIIHISSIELEPMTVTTKTVTSDAKQLNTLSTRKEKMSPRELKVEEFNGGFEFSSTRREKRSQEKENIKRSIYSNASSSKKQEVMMQFKQTKKHNRPPKASKRSRNEDHKKKLKIKKKKPKSKSPNLNLKFKEDNQRSRKNHTSRSKSKAKKPRVPKLKSSVISNPTQNNSFVKQKIDPQKILRPWRNNMAVSGIKPWKLGNREAQRSQRKRSRGKKMSRREVSKPKTKPSNNSLVPRKAKKRKRSASKAKEGSKTRRKRNGSKMTKKKRTKRADKKQNNDFDKENMVSGNKVELKKTLPTFRKKAVPKPPSARVSKKKVIEEILKENFERNQNYDEKIKRRGGPFAPGSDKESGDVKQGLQNVLHQKIKKLKKEFNSTFYKNKQVQSISSTCREKSPEGKNTSHCLFESKISKEDKKVKQYGIEDIKKTMLKQSSRPYNTPNPQETALKNIPISGKMDESKRKVVEIRMEKIVIVGEIKKRQAKSYERKNLNNTILTIPANDKVKRDAVSVELKKRKSRESNEAVDVRKKVIGENGEVFEGRPISIGNPINYRA